MPSYGQSPHDRERMLSTYQVATMLQVAPATVRRWCEDGLVDGAVKLPNGYFKIPESTAKKMQEAYVPEPQKT